MAGTDKLSFEVTPNNLSRQYQHARGLFNENKLKEAESALLQIIEVDPKFSPAYQLLSDVEWLLGHHSRVALTIKQWLTIEPQNATAWARLAVLNQTLGEHDKAMDEYTRATELAPDKVTYWVGLALSALEANNLNNAVDARDHLINKFPDKGLAHLIDGHIHKMQGSSDDAVSAYQHALELDPNLVSAIYSLVDIKTPSPDDPLTERIEFLSRQHGISDADRANLAFSLGRICDKAAQYDAAFIHYKHANDATLKDVSKLGKSYDPFCVEEKANKTIRTYPTGCFEHPIEPLPIELNLIFIVGLPRSGTTLIEQILGSHPEILPGGELPIAQACHEHYMSRRKQLNMRDTIDTRDNDEIALLLEAREYYLDRLFEQDLDAEYVTDKLPGNFEVLGFIRLLFPTAIVIHSRRNIVATCWSLFTSNFSGHDPYYNSLESLAHYCRMYQKLMQHWASVLEPPIIEAEYEDMVMRTEAIVRRLLSAIGLPWNDDCLASHKNPRPVLTASYNQVRQPIYQTSINRWRNYESHLTELTQLLPTN